MTGACEHCGSELDNEALLRKGLAPCCAHRKWVTTKRWRERAKHWEYGAAFWLKSVMRRDKEIERCRKETHEAQMRLKAAEAWWRQRQIEYGPYET